MKNQLSRKKTSGNKDNDPWKKRTIEMNTKITWVYCLKNISICSARRGNPGMEKTEMEV